MKKGRGSWLQPDGRYLEYSKEHIDDGWECPDGDAAVKTTLNIEKSKTIITKNNSPDIPFSQSINPYRGCEHGCVYCYARPTHAYFDLSPGLDFESKLFVKENAVPLLKNELAATSYQCSPIALGTNTDPYQPIERQYQLTRNIIKLLKQQQHPLIITTKSSLIERDIDLLAPMAKKNLVQIFISITTLEHELMRKLEPRASAPKRRFQTLSALSQAEIPAGVMFAPVIPCINEHEMEQILMLASDAGASHASYILIRLPHEVKILFKQWLEDYFPLRASHVINRIVDMRNGKENDPAFYSRFRGRGVYAELIKSRFYKACRKYGINVGKKQRLDTHLFVKPVLAGQQFHLF